MKAAYIDEQGPPENIIYGDLSTPEPVGSEVRVRTTAVAVNPIDTYIRGGADFWELPHPFIVGCDVAGVVDKIGPDVRRFQVGDRVWGSNQGVLGRQGSFAEFVVSDEDWLYPTPEAVDDQSVAAISLVGITAHLGLFEVARLKAGETIFVHGGTGGVGSVVVQMAKVTGARVITTGGSDEKVAAAKALGADVAVNYKTHDVSEALAEAAPEGVDVFFETLREPNFDAIVAALKPRGRIVVMAGRTARPEFPVGPFYAKGCSMHGFVMFGASPDEQRACALDINRWLVEGQLKAQISHRFSLSETAAAHALQESNTIGKVGTLAGKIVLVP